MGEIDIKEELEVPDFERRADAFVEQVGEFWEHVDFVYAENLTKELPKRLIEGIKSLYEVRKDVKTGDNVGLSTDIRQVQSEIVDFTDMFCKVMGIEDLDKYALAEIANVDGESASQNEVEVGISDYSRDSVNAVASEIIELSSKYSAKHPYVILKDGTILGCEIFSFEDETIDYPFNPRHYSTTLQFMFRD